MAARPLSPRQREILQLLGDGLTRREIGDRCGIATGTVDTILISAYSRLGVRSAPAAIAQFLTTDPTALMERWSA